MNSSSRYSSPWSSSSVLHVGQRARLQDVLEVGVPEPDPLEPDALRLGAAVGEVEQAPLAAEVHLDRPGDGPVQPHDVVSGARHAPNLTHWCRD